MRRFIFVLVLAFLAACSQVAPPEAVTDADVQFTASGVKGSGEKVAVSQKLGAVFVAGNTGGALAGEYKGAGDVFLRRYRRDGTVAWGRQIGGSAKDTVGGLALDSDNNIYVGTVKSKNTQLNIEYTGNLYKFNSDGEQLWVKRYTNYAGDDDPSTGSDRTIYSVNVSIDGGNNTYVVGDTGDSEFYVGKYGSDGTLEFFKDFEIPAYSFGGQVLSATVDHAGNSYISSLDSTDGVPANYLFKVSANGEMLWQQNLEQRGFTVVNFNDLKVIGDALYGSGNKEYYYFADADTYIADYDAYLAKYNLNGKKLWGKTIGTSNPEIGDSVTADTQGNVYITGRAYSSEAEMFYQQPSADYKLSQTFVQKYTADGSLTWKKQFSFGAKTALADIKAYSSSEIYATGRSDDTLPNATRSDGVLLTRLDGSGQTNWLNQ